jgi:hypothetical protein
MSTDIRFEHEVSLWECLHDGDLQSLTSDLLARFVTILIDVPYIREFHQLPSETRFRLVLSGVREVQAFQFAPWPGEFALPEGLSWEESQKLRSDNYKKGRLESIDWNILAPKLERTNQYEISNASVMKSIAGSIILQLDLRDDAREYPEIRIGAEKLTILTDPEREIPLEEFLSLGEAYWNAFAKQRSSNEP